MNKNNKFTEYGSFENENKKHQQMPVFFVKSYADNISAEVLFLGSREML